MKHKALIFSVICLFFVSSLAQGSREKVDLREIAEKIVKTFNSNDAIAMARLYTEDAVYFFSGEAEPLYGRKAIERNYANFSVLSQI